MDWSAEGHGDAETHKPVGSRPLKLILTIKLAQLINKDQNLIIVLMIPICRQAGTHHVYGHATLC